MKHKPTPPFIALALLGVASVNVSHAATVPSFPISSVPAAGYPSFINKALTVSLEKFSFNSQSFYQLLATGSGTFTFNFSTEQYAGTNGRLSLVAYFNESGDMIDTVGTTPLSNQLYIKGSLSASAPGSTPSWSAVADPSTLLWAAKLDAFGFDASLDTLGFQTTGFGGWANDPKFTGSGSVESLYLYDSLGLNGLTGALQPLTNAFAAHNLGIAPLTPIAKVQSIATVPVPAAFVLFGSAMAMLVSFRRKG